MATTDVQTTLRYLIPGVERPVYIASQAGADAAVNIAAEFEQRTVTIRDARLLSSPPVLDREGFQLVEHDSGVTDFYGDGWHSAYEAQITNLVLSATGGTDAMVFDHTLRSDSASVRGARTTREPASVIHNDYTDRSAARRVVDLLSPRVAQERLQHRFAIINVWRSVAGPVLRSPMTCCDAHTLVGDELIASERRAKERIGELELVHWRPQHRWCYFPAMHRGEALLLKTFDSLTDGRARRTIHSAFDNPLAPADAPARESIESRLLVFF